MGLAGSWGAGGGGGDWGQSRGRGGEEASWRCQCSMTYILMGCYSPFTEYQMNRKKYPPMLRFGSLFQSSNSIEHPDVYLHFLYTDPKVEASDPVPVF